MSERAIRIILVVFTAMILLAGTFSAGVLVGYVLPAGVAQAQSSSEIQLPTLNSRGDTGESDSAGTATPEEPAASQPQSTEELFRPFWEAWAVVHDQFVDQPVDDTQLMYGAIRGMMESLGDPHTSFMDPDEFKQATESLAGEYTGIGAWVDITGEYLMIISPIPNTPAEEADLRANDLVVGVNGKDMTGVDGEVVLKQILGPAGTDVTLTIQREGQEPFDVTITRAVIVLEAATSEMLDNGIAYLQLMDFGEKAPSQLRKELNELLDQNPSGLILDLRNNGGGYLHIAVQVVSEFISSGQVFMYEEFSDGSRRAFETERGGIATEIPLVVLVNEGTASASEIAAGAIQDYERGSLVGVTTYGKGSVQALVQLQNDSGALRVTTARWLTPEERLIHGIGLTPDYVVEITEEDIEAERDPQLEKAIELLTP